jgi:hypothetical protein
MAGKMDPSGIPHALLNSFYRGLIFIQPQNRNFSLGMLLDTFDFFLSSWDVGLSLGRRLSDGKELKSSLGFRFCAISLE